MSDTYNYRFVGTTQSDETASRESEFLTANEVCELTGYKICAGQRKWLDSEGWCYVTNASGRPIVGCWYARLCVAGESLHMAGAGIRPVKLPNFAALDD
ncbi:DUF4224 domain-containing protein [Xylella fastidiosa]|uniref:DUF4224 domain-containing protein n=1 Tax=Xylella fastidiosa subsp. fastidiosa TaxID=644356 RepID=A0AAJ5QYJ3_XYLFS|nr:DUF4224 domain-containing protein [Xylella fastidiosa]WCF27442.1 DUF4224 domain-containing protein [Xylella fastidiosa subsp. fastidiosa]